MDFQNFFKLNIKNYLFHYVIYKNYSGKYKDLYIYTFEWDNFHFRLMLYYDGLKNIYEKNYLKFSPSFYNNDFSRENPINLNEFMKIFDKYLIIHNFKDSIYEKNNIKDENILNGDTSLQFNDMSIKFTAKTLFVYRIIWKKIKFKWLKSWFFQSENIKERYIYLNEYMFPLIEKNNFIIFKKFMIIPKYLENIIFDIYCFKYWILNHFLQKYIIHLIITC
jgi:hypothetical protein